MQLNEVVEAEGHLIDSHIMEQIFDKVVEYGGRFEVEQFRIGRTNSEPSYLRLEGRSAGRRRDAAPAAAAARAGLLARGSGAMRNCATVERDRCAPEDFYSTTNHRTLVRRRAAMGRGGKPAHGRAGRGGGRARGVPAAARSPRRRSGGGGDARHPRGAGIEGARPAGVRVHDATASRRSARWRPPCGRPRR